MGEINLILFLLLNVAEVRHPSKNVLFEQIITKRQLRGILS